MTFNSLLLIATVNGLGMISPGPDFFMVMKNSLSYQRRYALMTCFGVIMGILTHMSYCIAGIAMIIGTTPWLFNLLRYAGVAYLIWIGSKAILARPSGVTYMEQQTHKITVSYRKAFFQGYLCNLLNPKATLFFLAIFTQFLAIDSTFVDKLVAAFIIWIEAMIWWPIVMIIFQSLIVQRSYYKIQFMIDKLLGIILIGLGISVAIGI